MAAEWPSATVQEIALKVASGPFGSNLKGSEYVETGVPVIRGGNLAGPQFTDSDYVYVSDAKANSLSGSLAYPLDIVFAARGTIGAVGLVPTGRHPRYLLSSNLVKFAVNPKEADPVFVFYYFRSWRGQQEILAHVNTTGVPKIERALESLRNFRVPKPPLSEQQAIAAVLGALDDKIELNQRMNETLEALAQNLFQSWFVDATQAGLPKGWCEVPLPEAMEVNPPRPLRKGEVAPYLDMANMPTRAARAMEVYDREFGSGMRFMDGDTLVARITPCLENGKTCFVDFLGDGKVGWGSTEYIVLRPKPPLPPAYAYFLARTESFRAFAISNMTGTSGRQRVPADCLNNFTVVVPPAEVAERFGPFARTVFAQIKAHDDESRTLAALRDALLPKLMSGELRVPAK